MIRISLRLLGASDAATKQARDEFASALGPSMATFCVNPSVMQLAALITVHAEFVIC
jgi:hypothetical protein